MCWCHSVHYLRCVIQKNRPFWMGCKCPGRIEAHLRHKWYDWYGTQISLRDWCRCTFIFLAGAVRMVMSKGSQRMTIFPKKWRAVRVATRWGWFARTSWSSSNLKFPKSEFWMNSVVFKSESWLKKGSQSEQHLSCRGTWHFSSLL